MRSGTGLSTVIIERRFDGLKGIDFLHAGTMSLNRREEGGVIVLSLCPTLPSVGCIWWGLWMPG